MKQQPPEAQRSHRWAGWLAATAMLVLGAWSATELFAHGPAGDVVVPTSPTLVDEPPKGPIALGQELTNVAAGQTPDSANGTKTPAMVKNA